MYVRTQEISQNVRMLGNPGLAFILGISTEEVERLLREGGEITDVQGRALQLLHTAIDGVKNKRPVQDNLDYVDLFQIQQLRWHDGSHLFNALRAASVENALLPKSDDVVLDALIGLGYEQFAILLVSQNIRDRPFGMPLFTSFTSSAVAKFIEEVRNDSDFAMFSKNDLDVGFEAWTTSGRGGGIQLAIFGDTLLRSAYALMRSKNSNSLNVFFDSCRTILTTLRRALRGQRTNVPAVLLFDNLSFEREADCKLPFGHLCNITEGLLELFPNTVRPPIHDGIQMGVALHLEIIYKIKIVEKIDFADPFPFLDEIQDAGRNSEQVALSTALALGDDAPSSAVHKGTLIIDPLFGATISWRPNLASPLVSKVASRIECGKIEEWGKVISNVDDQPIRLAVRRYLSALYERQNPSDSLIDCVVAMENLFGERSEISLSVAASVSKLIEQDQGRRVALFSQVKKLYGKRSAILHGSKVGDVETRELRAEALRILVQCLRCLYRDRPELLSLNSTQRSQKIILAN